MGTTNDHRRWVEQHGGELHAIGIPLAAYEAPGQWAYFLDHGALETFSVSDLGAAERRALHRFLELHFAERPPSLLTELRARHGGGWVGLPRTGSDGIRWLASRGASPWLTRHHELVLEAAAAIVSGLASELRLELDAERVLLGAALHDCGKILHPNEMSSAGHAHEAAGRKLLAAAGFPAEVSRVAVTHAEWHRPPAELEDRLVALADKLWKGKRDADLEAHLVTELSERTGQPQWETFGVFDDLCERVAADGPTRLRRSDVSTR